MELDSVKLSENQISIVDNSLLYIRHFFCYILHENNKLISLDTCPFICSHRKKTFILKNQIKNQRASHYLWILLFFATCNLQLETGKRDIHQSELSFFPISDFNSRSTENQEMYTVCSTLRSLLDTYDSCINKDNKRVYEATYKFNCEKYVIKRAQDQDSNN